MTAECLVLAPQEALVAGAAEAFERQLQQMFRRACLQLVVDLSGVHAIDNAGLQALVRAQATGARSGGSLRLAAARPVVLTRLEDAQLQHVFALYGSVRAARVAAWPWRTIGIAAAGVALCGALVWGGLSNQKFLGRLKSFVLRNNTQEGSGMHEWISMLFFKRMGGPAPREAHTRLFVNNGYMGLYTIVEAVDKAFLQRVNQEDEGYLFKYDYNVNDAPWYFNDRGTDPGLYVPSPFKPETHEADPHPEAIAELVRIVNRDSDAVFRKTIEPFVDFGTFIKHIAIEIFLADVDGFNGAWGINNFYLYRKDDRTPFQFIPWDKSEAFKAGPEYQIGRYILDVGPPEQNRLTLRVLRDPELRNRFLDQLVECARSFSAADRANPGDTRNWMEREVEREYQQISDSAAVSAEDRAYYAREAFEQEVENLRHFARRRAEFVLQEVARWRR